MSTKTRITINELSIDRNANDTIFVAKSKHRKMRVRKLKSELHTVDDFIVYYTGAGKMELKQALKNIGNSRDISKKNEKQAIQALLA